MILNDIKPAVLARDLIVMVLMHRLGQFESAHAVETNTEAALLAMTLQYTYLGVVMHCSIWSLNCSIIQSTL